MIKMANKDESGGLNNQVITNLYEVVLVSLYGDPEGPWPIWCDVLTFVSHLLLVFNSSSSIIIYCWKDQKFRRTLMRLLGFEPVRRSGSGQVPASLPAVVVLGADISKKRS